MISFKMPLISSAIFVFTCSRIFWFLLNIFIPIMLLLPIMLNNMLFFSLFSHGNIKFNIKPSIYYWILYLYFFSICFRMETMLNSHLTSNLQYNEILWKNCWSLVAGEGTFSMGVYLDLWLWMCGMLGNISFECVK